MTHTKFLNVNRTQRLDYVLGGAFNNSARGVISPGGWFREQTGGVKWDRTGEVAPVPKGIKSLRLLGELVRNLIDSSGTTATTNTTGNETSSNMPNNSFAALFVVDSKETQNQFRKAGYVNMMIPNLSFSVMIILVSSLWYFSSNLLLGTKITVRSNCFVKFIAYGGERTLWVALMLSVLELSLFSMNNLLNMSFDTLPRMLSTIAAVVCFIFLIAFPVFIFKLTNKHYTQLWNPEFYHRYAFFFCEFKLSTRGTKTFMSVIMGRLIIFGFLIAFFQSSPFLQTLSICLV